MASKVEKLDNTDGRLTIEIAPQEFKKAMEESYKKNRQRFTIPGFRKGKAPFSMVLNYYGEGVFYEDAVDSLLDPHYKKAIDEHEVEPHSHPDIDILEIGLDKGLVFTAEYALKPVAKLGRYQGFTAYRPDDAVSEDEITQELDAKRLELSRLVPVENRPVQEDDHVLIDYEGSIDGVPFEGGTAEGYTLEIGSGQFIPGFEEAIIGHSAGEEFAIDVTFPEDYHSEELAGKAAVFQVVLHEIKERQIPELDNDFIIDISEECNTVEEYRQDRREKLEETRRKGADYEFLEQILKQVVAEAEFEISDRIVSEEARRLMEQQIRYLAYNGIPFDYYIHAMGISQKEFLEKLKEPALDAIKHDLSLEAVAEAEGLKAGDEEIEDLLNEMAESYNMEVEDLRTQLGDNYAEQLAMDVRLKKAGDFLRGNSEATDEPPAEEDDELDEEAESEADTATSSAADSDPEEQETELAAEEEDPGVENADTEFVDAAREAKELSEEADTATSSAADATEDQDTDK